MVRVKTDWTREELVALCEASIVPMEKWHDRDSPGAIEGVGTAWALLKSGCLFKVRVAGDGCVTNERTVWIEITHKTFGTFDADSGLEQSTFYLPTPKRLEEAAGGDWY